MESFMFEYEKESNFSQKIGKSLSANYIQQLKEQLSLRQEAKAKHEAYDSKLSSRAFSIFALITFSVPALTVFLFLTSHIDIFKNIFVSFITGASTFLLSFVASHAFYHAIHKRTWFKNLNLGKYFKKSQALKNEYLIQNTQVLDTLQQPEFQKELINYLNQLVLIENDNYDNPCIENDLNDLILMFSDSQYKSAQKLIADNIHFWENISTIPKDQEDEKETVSKFLKSLNVKLEHFSSEENYDIKTKL